MRILNLLFQLLKSLLRAAAWICVPVTTIYGCFERIHGHTADATYHMVCAMVLLAFLRLPAKSAPTAPQPPRQPERPPEPDRRMHGYQPIVDPMHPLGPPPQGGSGLGGPV